MPPFLLAKYFNCSPHEWDNLPPERVLLDYFTMLALKEIEAKEMDKLKRKNAMGQTKGRSVKTTSDTDFFERMNRRMD
tara:strand:+ start:3272 stop:3505 length:234 start_codon:yes stop_codon:yes gene_type:complete